MKIHLLSVLISLLPYSIHAQEKLQNVGRISIKEVSFQCGLISQNGSYGNIEDFKALAPKSVLLNNDMSGFSQYDNSGMSNNNVFSFLVGIQFRNKEKLNYKTNPLLRLGITYFGATTLSSGLYKTHTTPYDTLTSSQTGELIYVDSVNKEQYR